LSIFTGQEVKKRMTKSDGQHIKLGVIGTGRIANRFIREVEFVKGIKVTAVYNPHLNSAEIFAQRHGINTYTNDLNVFLRNIDAVYIASPHDTHYEYAKSSLINGKNVLCEKPSVLKKYQAEKLFNIAEKYGLVFMEALKTAYAPGFLQLIKEAKSGKIGEIRDVESCFTKITDTSLRELADIKYGGSFTELASYTLLPIIKLLGTEYIGIRFDSFTAQNGVDVYTKAYFKFKNAVATSKTGLGVKSEGQLIISGTCGYIRVDAPWWKTQTFEVCFEDMSKNEKYAYDFKGDGLRYEINDFVSAIKNRSKPKLSAHETIAMAEIMEKFLEQRK